MIGEGDGGAKLTLRWIIHRIDAGPAMPGLGRFAGNADSVA